MIRAHVSAQEGIGSISSDASRPLWCRLGVRAARLESERQSLPDRATTRRRKQMENLEEEEDCVRQDAGKLLSGFSVLACWSLYEQEGARLEEWEAAEEEDFHCRTKLGELRVCACA